MMSSTKTKSRKLSITRENLRALSPTHLGRVAAAGSGDEPVDVRKAGGQQSLGCL